jgi:hypothetical protein
MAAIEMRQAGKTGPPAQLYGQFISREDQIADVSRLVGMLYHQQGEHACGLVGTAITLLLTISEFHASRAEVPPAVNQFNRAAGCCSSREEFRNYPG